MLEKLTASAATSFLLLGASGGAMAQEPPVLPPLVVYSVQATPDLVVPISEGTPCADALQGIGNIPLDHHATVVVNAFIVFQFMGSGNATVLVTCAPEGIGVPTAPSGAPPAAPPQ